MESDLILKIVVYASIAFLAYQLIKSFIKITFIVFLIGVISFIASIGLGVDWSKYETYGLDLSTFNAEEIEFKKDGTNSVKFKEKESPIILTNAEMTRAYALKGGVLEKTDVKEIEISELDLIKVFSLSYKVNQYKAKVFASWLFNQVESGVNSTKETKKEVLLTIESEKKIDGISDEEDESTLDEYEVNY